MEIRFYKNEDFSQLEDIFKKTDLYYEPFDDAKILEDQIKHDSESIIVAETEGKVVGGVFILYNPWLSFVYHLCVHPDYQKEGIGSSLMDKAEDILRKRGIEEPGLFVDKRNEKVLDFYKKRGWLTFNEAIPLGKKI